MEPDRFHGCRNELFAAALALSRPPNRTAIDCRRGVPERGARVSAVDLNHFGSYRTDLIRRLLTA
jgi:hypothetical protein